jgi:hypothetical protein
MEDVYCAGDEPLAVALKVKFMEDPKGVKVETEISFVKERVKEKWAVVVDEKQLKLDGVESVSFTYGDQTVTLGEA